MPSVVRDPQQSHGHLQVQAGLAGAGLLFAEQKVGAEQGERRLLYPPCRVEQRRGREGDRADTSGSQQGVWADGDVRAGDSNKRLRAV